MSLLTYYPTIHKIKIFRLYVYIYFIEITIFEPPVNKVIIRLSITNSNLMDVCVCTCSCEFGSSASSAVALANLSAQIKI